MANINKIRLSGQTYDIQDPNASKTVELTQAQYDALVSGGTVDPNTFYVITDAQGADLSNYYTKSETSGATQISTALSGKQDTLISGTNIKTINNTSILGSGNIDIQGGGKAIEAGRGISITTGATADTVSFNLPISAGTGTNSIKCGESNDASGTDSFAIGSNGVKASGQCSFAGGSYSEAKQIFSMAFGRYSIANNYGEVALGFFNQSNGSSSVAGNSSGNTLFSVGNGTDYLQNRHNAFEIRQNGDIYCNNGTSDVKLQDYIQYKIVQITQAAYDALVSGGTVDSGTVYIIVN